jgi:hypothetical protein
LFTGVIAHSAKRYTFGVSFVKPVSGGGRPMTPHPPRKILRCAIYTRKSTEHNLDLEFNSLDAQREACEAYIKSQAHEGWRLVRTGYDDGGLSGASSRRTSRRRSVGTTAAFRALLEIHRHHFGPGVADARPRIGLVCAQGSSSRT